LTEQEIALAALEQPADPNPFLQKCLESFTFFVRALWYPIGSWKVAPLGAVELDICDYVENGPQFRGILAFRGIGKTHFVTGAYAAWRLLRDPDTKILIVSKSVGEAKKTLKMIRGWFAGVWFLHHLSPNDTQTNNLTELDVGPSADSRNPSITAVGIEGQLPSKRAHLIIGDDVETPGNTKTIEARDQLSETVSEFRAIASYGKQEIIYVGTFHNEDSLYIRLEKKGYKFRSWPKVYPGAAEELINLAPMLAGHLAAGIAKPGDITCPHRVSKADIALDMGEGFRYWAMQCQLNKSLGRTNRYPLRLNDLIVHNVGRDKAPASVQWGTRDHKGSTRLPLASLGLGDDALYGPVMLDPHWSTYEGPTKAGLDPAGRGTDKTGLAIGAVLAGMVWVKSVLGLPGGVDDASLNRIAIELRNHNAREVTVETNNDVYDVYVKFLNIALQRHFLKKGDDPLYPEGWQCSVVTTHATGMKESRIIATLEPIISGHRMVIDPSCLLTEEENQQDELQFQLTRLCNERHCLKEDGKLDALQILVASLTHAVGKDHKKAAAATKARDYKDQMNEMRKLRGLPPAREPGWINR